MQIVQRQDRLQLHNNIAHGIMAGNNKNNFSNYCNKILTLVMQLMHAKAIYMILTLIMQLMHAKAIYIYNCN